MIAIPKPRLTLYQELLDSSVVLSLNNDGTLGIDAPKGLLTEDLIRRIRTEKPKLIRMLQCDRCDSTELVDHPIHAGRSLRRGCEVCGRILGFPQWNPPKD